MPMHTESYESHTNEDGSVTTTEVTTFTPPTPKQQALAWTGLGLLVMAPFVPLAATVAYDKYVERRDARKARKAAKKND